MNIPNLFIVLQSLSSSKEAQKANEAVEAKEGIRISPYFVISCSFVLSTLWLASTFYFTPSLVKEVAVSGLVITLLVALKALNINSKED